MSAFLICRIAEPSQDDAIFYSLKQKLDAIREATLLGPWYIKHQSLGLVVPSNLREGRPTTRQHALFMSHWPQKAYSCVSHPMKDPNTTVNVLASEVGVSGTGDDGDERMVDMPSIEYPPGSSPSDIITFTGTGVRSDKLPAYWKTAASAHLSPSEQARTCLPLSTIVPEYATAPVLSFCPQEFDDHASSLFKLNIPCLGRGTNTHVISGFAWQLNSFIICFGSVKSLLRRSLQEHGQSLLVYISTVPVRDGKERENGGRSPGLSLKLPSVLDYRILLSLFERLELPAAMTVNGHVHDLFSPTEEVRAFCQILR